MVWTVFDVVNPVDIMKERGPCLHGPFFLLSELDNKQGVKYTN